MDLFFFGGTSFSRGRRNKSKGTKKKKPKAANWFETLNTSQLKELCKASKLHVSGTKTQLCDRLMQDDYARGIGNSRQVHLKEELKEEKLVQSGNKFDQVLRLMMNKKGTGAVKRAATETIVDENTGKEVEVLKKRKVMPKPSTIYTRIEKKIKAVSQKKYQTNYGSKSHAPHVMQMLSDLIDEYCIQSNIMTTDPILAFEVSKAGFQSLYDHWQFMERPGYASYETNEAFSKLGTVLKTIQVHLSADKVEEMVALLENVNAILGGYCLNMSYKENYNEKYNIVEEAICLIMPGYDKEKRTTKPEGKALDCDIRSIAWMNGITLPVKEGTKDNQDK